MQHRENANESRFGGNRCLHVTRARRGEELDARTDLFSVGVVLYEMAVSQRLFQGNTNAIIFDAVRNKTPMSPVRLATRSARRS